MKVATLTTIALLLTIGAAQAAPLVPAHVPADAKWVIHVDFEQMRASKLSEACRAEMEKHDKFNEKIKEVTEKLGMNPMKDLLGVTAYDTKYGTRKGVVLIHCNKLDRKKLHAMFEKKHPDAKTSKYGDWTLSTWHAKHKHGEHMITGTFANDNTIALSGDADKLKRALDVITGKSKSASADSELLAGIGKKSIMAARAINVDPEYMKKTRCPVLKNCTEATVVWKEKKGQLSGQYAFVTKDENTAKSFKAVVEGMKGLARIKLRGNELAMKLVNGLKAKAKGNELSVSFKANSDDIIDAAKKMKDMKKKWGGRHDHHKHGHDHKKKEEI